MTPEQLAVSERSRRQVTNEELGPVGSRGSAVPACGVVLFDNSRDMSEGWACRAGDRPFRITSVAELTADTIWVTNLDFTEYSERAKRLSHLRRNDYLRSTLTAIGQDIGCRITGSYAAEAIPLLAGVVSRSVNLAVAAYGWRTPASDVREDVLQEDIRRSIVGIARPQPDMRAPLMSAHQAYSSPDWPYQYDDNTVNLTLRFGRLEHAQAVMSTLVPDDAWTFIPPAKAADFTIEQLLDPSTPTLVEAAVELSNVDPDLARLVAFGAQPGKRNSLRKWISQPELAWLSRHARVQVTSVLMCRAAVPIPAQAQLPKMLTQDPLMTLSVSAGLLAEAHWSALASPVYLKAIKGSEVSHWGVWLRAADRAACFNLALKAHTAGFRVTGYGSGSVLVRLQRHRLRECLDFAIANRLSHPCFAPIFKEHGIA